MCAIFGFNFLQTRCWNTQEAIHVAQRVTGKESECEREIETDTCRLVIEIAAGKCLLDCRQQVEAEA